MNLTWPRSVRDVLGFDFSPYPNLVRWMKDLEERPAFAKALAMRR